MNGSDLLDTNIIVALFNNEDIVRERIASSPAIVVPVVVIGELYYGAQHSARVEDNIEKVREFAATSTILDCDLETAEHYGRIKNLLRTKGRPLPENDIWIAAVAMQHSLILITRDHHFQQIDGLHLEEW